MLAESAVIRLPLPDLIARSLLLLGLATLLTSCGFHLRTWELDGTMP